MNSPTPLECASLLVKNEPENAGLLLDLLISVRSIRDDPLFEAQLDKAETMLYSKTEDCQRHQESHRRSRLVQLVPNDDPTS